jgi:anti-sigma regulatory factor (Ser/Thr protein kinase)
MGARADREARATPVRRHRDAVQPTPFRHEAMVYHGEAQFLAGTLAFIEAGLTEGEQVLVAVCDEKIDLLRSGLGRDADDVSFADMTDVGRNPALLIPLWAEFVDRNQGRHVRGIGEPVWPGRSDAAIIECRTHEALVNTAFGGGASWDLLCPYDAETLAPQVIGDARATHPFLIDGADHGRNADFDPQLATLMGSDELPPPATAPAHQIVFGTASLGDIRQLVADYAVCVGLHSSRVDDFVLATNELVGNSVRHGGGAGELRLWVEPRRLLAEVRDRGSITDPLVGRRRPTPQQAGGRGLWIANQVCDLVQIRSSPGSSVVRLHMAL